jgi:hypothetical protein
MIVARASKAGNAFNQLGVWFLVGANEHDHQKELALACLAIRNSGNIV